MEAALWGRIETVRYLLENKADPWLQDGLGLMALDLATETQRNTAEREDRAGVVYREPASASQSRKVIATMLRQRQVSPNQDTNPAPTPSPGLGFFKILADGRPAYYEATTVYDFPNGWTSKAFAQLDRGLRYPRVSSMSGYTQPNWANVLDNDIWTAKALDIGRVIGYNMNKGLASHVEKQLIAYYIDRHVVFEEDGFAEAERRAAYHYPNTPLTMADCLDELRGHQPPCTLVNSKQAVCGDCLEFIRLVQQHFDIEIETVCVQ